MDEALAWHLALEGDDADWDAYTVWLEADPRHRLAFDQISLVDDAVLRNRLALGTLLSEREIEGADRVARMPTRRLAIGAAVAAAAVAAVGIPVLMRSPPPATYRTGPGESRTIALADASHVQLAASSALTVTGGDRQSITLEHGAAYFDIRHDPSRRLVVSAGSYRISDIGTKFSVNLAGGALELAVSEGQVDMTAAHARTPVRISAGYRLTADGAGSSLSPIAPGDVGSWRSGRLVYADAPIALVAADIGRYSGQRIIVDPTLKDRRFSGVLTIGDGSRLLVNLASFMAIATRAEGDGIRISAAAGD